MRLPAWAPGIFRARRRSDGSAGKQWSKKVPTYEYRCQSNGRLVEVRHDMAERLATCGDWGE